MAEPYSVRFSQYLRRVFSLREQYTPALAEEFVPTIQLRDPWESDNARDREVHYFGVGVTQAAGLGNVGDIILQAAPNTIAVIKRITLQTDGTGTVANWTANWERATFLQNVPPKPISVDGRAFDLQQAIPSQSRRQFSVRTELNPFLALSDPFLDLFSGLLNWMDVDWIIFGNRSDPNILPGNVTSWRIRIRSSIANLAIHCSIQGYERSIEQAETF